MTKSPALYRVILLVWAALFGLALLTTAGSLSREITQRPVAGVLALVTLLSIGYFWLNGIKDVLYTAWYYLVMRGRIRPVRRRELHRHPPRVVMVYCTRNDFNANSLAASMKQRYTNVHTVILDDSDKPEYLTMIDIFAATHDVQVVRRENHVGFKAGNLNNYLTGADYDYFVILDSDEIIPPRFIRRMLDYFASDQSIGIVQATHVATRNVTRFQQKFSLGVDSHWPVYQSVKNRYGFLSLLGHGAMVSKQAFDAAGGFPLMVAEDLCFSLAVREHGYTTVFAPDVTCQEEFPVDYLAFRKRHSKWTQGNMEFIRKNTRPIMTSRQLHWYEKLDIVLFTYALPLTAVFSVFVVINVVVLPMMHASFQFPLWMLIPTVAFLVAPMVNDVVFHWARMAHTKLLSYSGGSMMLYGSMYFTSLRSSLKSMFGNSVFLVTPKDSTAISFREALRSTRSELIFAGVLAVISLVFTRSVFPVFLLVLPAMVAPYLMVRHQPTRAELHERQRGKVLQAA